MRPKTKRTSFNKKTFLVIGVIIGLGLSAAAILTVKDQPPKKDTVDQTAYNDVKTYESSSEGSTFQVPEDVPPESIINYTLITEEERFKIRKHPDSDAYIITLYAVINRPDQYDMYRDQLREYKQAALDYLADKGVTIDEAKITYEPEEATQL